MLVDGLFDRFVGRLRRSRQQPNEFFSNQTHTDTQRSNWNKRRYEVLKGAQNFVMNQPTFIENGPQIVHTFAAGKGVHNSVLQLIAPHTDPNAAVDSSARFPPPLFHPGTRRQIGDRLFKWLTNPVRQWNMIWLNGPAGTGKSAVAQTFAERCVEDRCLGAAFFFSRPNDRNNPDTVIPSLVYQLAVHLPSYKSLVTDQLTNDPQLMWKALHIQFKQLIVGPLLQLQSQKQTRIREHLLIILDGLDECQGEDAQREIIDMMSEAMRLNRDLPLLWLICSRPEAHLKHIFSQTDYTANCGREELAIDAESMADVDLYIQDALAGIKAHFRDVVTPTWPSEEQVTQLLDKAVGHFGFASTALRYIGDTTCAVPMARFDDLLSFLKGVRTGVSNLLEALDTLYAGILRDVPDQVLQITKRILGHYIFVLRFNFVQFRSVQQLCNFLQIDQATFYSALQKLHSVIDVPTSETASKVHLRFYHTSFEDYLRDRSGGFIIESNIWLDNAKMCFSWMKVDVEQFHINSSLESIRLHEHGILPGLKWVSDSNRAKVSEVVAYQAWDICWWASFYAKWDKGLLSQIHDFDFRYVRSWPLWFPCYYWHQFVDKLWKVDSSSGIIRTKLRNEGDFHLLEHVKSLIKPGVHLEPAIFPLEKRAPRSSYYFLVGHGSKAIVCWATGHEEHNSDMMACGETSSKEGIDVFKTWLIGKDD